MKQLKFNHKSAQMIAKGIKTSTFRMFDDKELTVNDKVEIIDKKIANKPSTWEPIVTVRINSIIEKRLNEINDIDLKKYEIFSNLDNLKSAFKKYYGSRNFDDEIVKIINFTVINNRYNLVNRDVLETTSNYTLKLYADGGSRGNPGPSASGYVIYNNNGEMLVKKGLYLGVTTNNQAEYQALKLGLDEALNMNASVVLVYMDSMLVINQMNGVFKVKNRDLWPIHDELNKSLQNFQQVKFTQIPRALNKEADSVVNDVLDAEAKKQAL